jgi:hypothetical protein
MNKTEIRRRIAEATKWILLLAFVLILGLAATGAVRLYGISGAIAGGILGLLVLLYGWAVRHSR